MDLLVRTARDVGCDGREPCLEVGDRGTVRVVIVDSESSSKVYVVDLQSVSFEICDDLIDSLAFECEYFLYSGDL